MNATKTGMALAAAVAMALPMHATAQRGFRANQGPGIADRGQGVEMVLRLRDRLELTDPQVEQLNALRQEAVERRSAHQAQMDELRSRVMAGEMTRAELLEIAQARREGGQEVRDQQRERVEAVLNEDQLQELETIRATARGFARGRASAQRGLRSGGGQGQGCPGALQGRGGRAGAWGPGARGGARGPGALGPR